MNEHISKLFENLTSHEVKYCHWKSNNNLDKALAGIDDLDILVALGDYGAFSVVVAELGFRLAIEKNGVNNPFVFHYYALDPSEGILVHLHVYFRIVTGGSLVKNHWIPVEGMLLENRTKLDGVPVPVKEADFILFVLRKFIEQPSLAEHYLFYRDYNNIIREYRWLTSEIDRVLVDSLLAKWLPNVPSTLFWQCAEVLPKKHRFLERVRLGNRILGYFPLTVAPSVQVSVIRIFTLLSNYVNARIRIFNNKRTLHPGGLIIAFVGSEASGKSTLSSRTGAWLGEVFEIERVHMGKPRRTWRTRVPFLVIGLYSGMKRAIKRSTGKTGAANRLGNAGEAFEPHPVVAYLDAIDRFSLIRKCSRRMMAGSFVLMDRYPETKQGGIDGPRISGSGPFTNLLGRMERRIYSNFPPIDVIFKVMAPLETTLERNAGRAIPEPEDFVKFRFEKARGMEFRNIKVIPIDTSFSLDECLLKIKQGIWACVTESGSEIPINGSLEIEKTRP